MTVSHSFLFIIYDILVGSAPTKRYLVLPQKLTKKKEIKRLYSTFGEDEIMHG